MNKRIVTWVMLLAVAFFLVPCLSHARWYSPQPGQFTSIDPAFDFPNNFGNEYGYVGNDPINSVDLSGENAYVAYRKLNIAGLGWTNPVTGHVYLAFDDQNMGTAWRSAAGGYGFRKNATAAAGHRQNQATDVYEYDNWLTFSYHPLSVRTGDGAGNRASVIYTDSWIVMQNDYGNNSDIAGLESGATKRYLITQNESEQIRILNQVMRYQQQQGTNIFDNYSFAVNNCGVPPALELDFLTCDDV